jgi:hypothetical protein
VLYQEAKAMSPLEGEDKAVVVEAARRITGEYPAMRAPRGVAWVYVGPVIGAAVMGLAAWVWTAAKDKLRDDLTIGSAKTVVVEQLRADNAAEHQALQADIAAIKKEQSEQGRLMKRVARKLRVEE